MLKKLKGCVSALLVLSIAGCASVSASSQQKEKSLSEVFKNDFLIGTAMDSLQIIGENKSVASLIDKQFNAITAENVMKSEKIHLQWGKYDFSMADRFVNFGLAHKKYIVGHTLIWHSQLSPFVKNLKSKDSLLAFMDEHINTIVNRFKGKIDCWDVVNEALNEDGTFRKSIFFEKLGADYIAKAFKLAAQADPVTKLYYNDYNIELPKKRAGAIALVKKLKSAGVKIDGIGIQGHWHLGKVPFEDIENSIIEFAGLGLKVAITELDINVLPAPEKMVGAEVSQKFEGNSKLNPYAAGLPLEKQQQLASEYEKLFKIFLKHKDKISRITFWGVNDGQSWLNDWPVSGRTNYPLLFDRNYQPKPAFYSVLNVASNRK